VAHQKRFCRRGTNREFATSQRHAWSADYLVEATRLENRMDLRHVRVTNQSGEDYENAQIRLVVVSFRIVEEIGLARRSQG